MVGNCFAQSPRQRRRARCCSRDAGACRWPGTRRAGRPRPQPVGRGHDSLCFCDKADVENQVVKLRASVRESRRILVMGFLRPVLKVQSEKMGRVPGILELPKGISK